MKNNIIQVSAALLSAGIFQLFTYLEIGNTGFDRSLFVFVSLFFSFLLFMFLSIFVPEKISNYLSPFSFTLLGDGVMLFFSTILIGWAIGIFKEPSDVSDGYFLIGYLIFLFIMNLVTKKKFIYKVACITLFLPVVLWMAISISSIFFPSTHIDTIKMHLPIFLVYDAVFLLAILLYYWFSKAIREEVIN